MTLRTSTNLLLSVRVNNKSHFSLRTDISCNTKMLLCHMNEKVSRQNLNT